MGSSGSGPFACKMSLLTLFTFFNLKKKKSTSPNPLGRGLVDAAGPGRQAQLIDLVLLALLPHIPVEPIFCSSPSIWGLRELREIRIFWASSTQTVAGW